MLGVCISSPDFAAAKEPVYHFLKEPAVKWKNQRLTGEVENAPVKFLLTELLRKGGADWEVIGNLNATTNVIF